MAEWGAAFRMDLSPLRLAGGRPSCRSQMTALATRADGKNSAAAATSGWGGRGTSGPVHAAGLSRFLRRTPRAAPPHPPSPRRSGSPHARHLSSGPPDQLDPVGRRVVALLPPNEPSILTTRFCGDE